MKHWSKILAVFFIAGLIAGCHSEEKIPDEWPDDKGEREMLYMNVNVALPTKTLARSTTGNTGQEVGQDYENHVASILLVLADTKDKYVTHGIVGGLPAQPGTRATITATAAISRTGIQRLYDNNGILKDPGNNKVHVYVFCNPTQDLIDELSDMEEGHEADWANKVCRVLQNDIEGSDKNTTIWSNGLFLMSNAGKAERLIPNTFQEWVEAYATEANPFNLSGDNGGNYDNATNDRGAIDVERSVARFDFRDGSGTGKNTYNIGRTPEGKEDDGLQVQLIRMGLVNMSKEFYYLRRVSADGKGENAVIGGKETASNYVVDTDAEFKQNDLNTSEVINKLKDHFNFRLFNNDGRIDASTRRQWDNYWIDDVIKGREDNDEGWTPEAGTSVVKDYRIWRYVTENTIPGNDDHQKNGISTGIVFKGKLLAGTNLETTNEQLYKAIRGEYTLPEGIKGYTYNVEGSNAVYPILYTFQNQIYVGWNTGVKVAAQQTAPGHPLHSAARIGEESGPDKLYQQLIEIWDEGKGDVQKTEEALAAFRKAATEAGFTLYQASNDAEMDKDNHAGVGYYFYYYYWNRHNDNGFPGTMGTMEFGVVRNNVYKLAVTGISKLGHPRITSNDPDPVDPDDPDESGEVYLTVSVEVLPWTVRVNNIEF
ncbi:Mfa1 family fimbria major subunit [Sanguibacteroides sp. AM78-02pH3A]|nr:Mfa1 family fimbria major subunit [Sanguibacteroides sp. AM78-02pH3A]